MRLPYRSGEEAAVWAPAGSRKKRLSGRMGACYAYCVEVEGGHGRPRHQRQRAVGEGGAFGGEPLPLALQSLKRYSDLAAGGFVSRAALPTGRFTRVRAARSRGAGLTEPAGVAEASFVIFPLKRHGKDA